MDSYAVISVSAFLLLAAAVLIIVHVWAWRVFQRQKLDDEELDFRRRQFRRRTYTSGTLGLLAASVFVGYILTLRLQSGRFALVYWTAVMMLACWVVLLAAMDIWATNRHFGRLRHNCLVEQAKLQAQIRHIQAVRGNGKAGKLPLGNPEDTKRTEKEEG